MTCKKCYHNEVCEALYELNGVPKICACQCAYFRNAADVVEVVRCKDCKFYKAYKPPIEDFDGFCTVNENEYDKDFFCQYGERRENG